MIQSYDIVIPSVGRDSLALLLQDLAENPDPCRMETVVVDDRANARGELAVSGAARVIVSGGGGPARARNLGWRATSAQWVVFLDDDVRLASGWSLALANDLAEATGATAGIQGRIKVPLGPQRPTDWERNVRGLEVAQWATADMAYRRQALDAVGGFDERFPRAYREDSDLALRCRGLGFDLTVGTRTILHPVRPASNWTSVRLQRSNADDARMRARYGPLWRRHAAAGGGPRFAVHVLTSAIAGFAALFALVGLRRSATIMWTLWTVLVGEFAWSRISPGPRTVSEVARMLVTSILIPPYATYHRVRGEIEVRRDGDR